MAKGPIMIPEYKKKFTTNLTEKDTNIETKEEVIKSIINLPPIVARGIKDRYIELIDDSDNLVWNLEELNKMEEIVLRLDRNVFENKIEYAKGRW